MRIALVALVLVLAAACGRTLPNVAPSARAWEALLRLELAGTDEARRASALDVLAGSPPPGVAARALVLAGDHADVRRAARRFRGSCEVDAAFAARRTEGRPELARLAPLCPFAAELAIEAALRADDLEAAVALARPHVSTSDGWLLVAVLDALARGGATAELAELADAHRTNATFAREVDERLATYPPESALVLLEWRLRTGVVGPSIRAAFALGRGDLARRWLATATPRTTQDALDLAEVAFELGAAEEVGRLLDTEHGRAASTRREALLARAGLGPQVVTPGTAGALERDP